MLEMIRILSGNRGWKGHSDSVSKGTILGRNVVMGSEKLLSIIEGTVYEEHMLQVYFPSTLPNHK